MLSIRNGVLSKGQALLKRAFAMKSGVIEWLAALL
jgi:hypothetical protein